MFSGRQPHQGVKVLQHFRDRISPCNDGEIARLPAREHYTEPAVILTVHLESSTVSWWLYILYPSSDYDVTYYAAELLLLLLLLLLIGALVKIA